MTTDKTGAPTSVRAHADKFTIAVDGHEIGLTAFVDHDDQRIFHHTEVGDDYEGRGLATILVGRRSPPPARRVSGSSPSANWWPTTWTSTRLRRHRGSRHRRHRAVRPGGGAAGLITPRR